MGSIFGKVTDSTGGVMPGVAVTVSGTALQQPLTAVTSASGTYQFPTVPIGTYSVTFELDGFKKAVRNGIIITTGFSAPIDQKMEVGNKTEEVTVSAAPPVVDTKKTNTGSTFTKEILENIPSARDPWQIINMTPGVMAGLNVGGSASGQQVGLASRGTSANVQWNLEGGSITDLSSNSSPSYFNFDSFEQIQVVNGGGDVSVQSSGLSINLVTKSGSNVFKGSAVTTFMNDAMQNQNVTRELFNAGGNGFISGAPIRKIFVMSGEYGGPIKKNRLWFWGAADKQDINVGVLNFFDPAGGDFCAALIAAQKTGATALAGQVTFDKLNDVVKCLKTDTTVIKDLQWKFNYQLNSANKFQYLFQSDNKYRNARDASANTATEATSQQTSDSPKGVGYWGLPAPTHSVTHTFIATDKLVFNNMFTYVHGGFYLDYQDVAPQGDCPQSKYIDGANTTAAYDRNASCLWMTQARSNRTTGLLDRSKLAAYQTARPGWEAKSDGTYFLTNTLGGDHSLKFGLGWRRNPISTFSHYSGGARATMQCVGNLQANCGGGTIVSAGAAAGYVPYQAVLYRDGIRNNDWWSYNGYIQDAFSRGKLRLNGGLRYDWQQSKHRGGCVAPNPLRPDLFPAQCDEATQVDSITGKSIKPFGAFAPRLSATYDLFGNGKTSVHTSFSYYYDTKITLANSLSSLFDSVTLTWGQNQASGACSTTAGAPCWNDANRDSLVQINELIGTPTSNNARFTPGGGVSVLGNNVDESTKLGRTREVVAGVQHELISNLAVGVDYIYRKYDNGSRSYSQGYQPGSGQNLASLYTGVNTFTDPITGLTAPYYYIPATTSVPTGLATIVSTDTAYRSYHGVDLTMTKRFSSKWQANVSATVQRQPQWFPEYQYTDPQNVEFGNSHTITTANANARFLGKIQASYQMPWNIMTSVNLNINDGAVRTLTINGPGNVPGGFTASTGAARVISRATLQFEDVGNTRYKPTQLLDLGAQKVLSFKSGKYRLKVMFDAFNVFNINTITTYSGSNRSLATFTQPTGLVPPRVFRLGGSINF